MHRRTLLQVLTPAIASAPGCLDGRTGENTTNGTRRTSRPEPTSAAPTTVTATPTPSYERCDRFVIPTVMLPRPVREEVNEALREGAVTKSRILLTDAMDIERSYLLRDETYYEASVTQKGAESTLRVAAVERPTYSRPLSIVVYNEDESHEITVWLAHDGETVVERTVELPAGTRRQFDATRYFGQYELGVEVPGYDSLAVEIEFDEVHFGPAVTVDEDRIWHDQSVATPLPCPWQN